MIASFVISFREAFEALIIVALIITYLKRMNKEHLVGSVVMGSALAVIVSILVGVFVYLTPVLVVEKELVEVVGAFIAVPVLASVLYWMARKGARIKEEVKARIEKESLRGSKAYIGMVSFGFIVVFREGLETVLFTLPLLLRDLLSSITGLSLGVLASLMVSYAVLRYGVRMDLKKFSTLQA